MVQEAFLSSLWEEIETSVAKKLLTLREVMATTRAFFQDGLLNLLCWLCIIYGVDICGSSYFVLIFFSNLLFIAVLVLTKTRER